MNLKKLEILGFKSFANKTTIDFSRGMTAIVGPNGCGKTNILDSLRWVLGEQKVSMLRGSKMEEVIFNGTNEVKPLGMAEVTLTLENNRGLLPTEYTELQITRRLFRSGESEYLLNKVPCRLKDINDLFFDTGMGAHSYSVIQQDMIESVISDKAEERRFLFEEAAGITKYKQRKKAALRKLDATEQDFLRLNDIYSEVQTQVRSLKRQQKKAERYQMVSDEIKTWELYLSSSRIKEIENERRTIRASLDQMGDQISEKEASLNKISSDLEAERKEQIDFEQDLSRLGNEIYDVTEEAHSLETEITILREKNTNASHLIERNTKEIQASRTRKEMLISQKDENDKLLEQYRQETVEIETELDDAEKIQAEADRNLLAARSSKEDHNKKMIELEGKLSSGKTEDDNLKQRENDLNSDINKLSEELDSNAKKKESLLAERNQKREMRDTVAQNKQDAEERLTDKTKYLEELIEKNENFTSEIAHVNSSIEASQARINLLEEMILHYEGYESGVKAVMEVKDRWNGIYGTVAEKFVPAEGMESAVEAALSEMARFIICNNRRSAEAIIQYLKDENKGKVGILVPDAGMINPVVKRPDIELDEFVGWMDNFVKTDEDLTPLMQAVLSRTAVFKSGYSPDKILERLPYGFNAVSTTGELFSKNIIAGGSDNTFSLFRRKEKIEEQQDMIEQFNAELEKIQKEKNQTNASIASTRAEISKLSDQIETYAEELIEAQNEFNEVEYQLRAVDSEIIRLEKEIGNLKGKVESIKHRQYNLSLDFNSLSDQKESLVSSMNLDSEQLSALEMKSNEALNKVSNLRVKVVECRSRIQQIESKIAHDTELIADLEQSIENKSREIISAKDEIQSSKVKTVKLEEELKIKFNQRQELTSKQNELRSHQSDILERVNAKEKQLREIRSEKESINNNSHQVEIRLNTLESETKTITERIEEEYSLAIDSIEQVNPDESMDRAQAVEHLHDLKEQLKKFGAVNLLALEEYRVASEREAFLREQLQDLTAAKNDLTTTISKINQTAKQLFEETFNQVKDNFKNLFKELFTGGEASVYLTDPSDPLESDIEIIARPRGKKLLSITMMSGGERALTAISLLFSLYMVKPSPFCILDEIDAPLDDANCRRFLTIIETFSKQTQFILITHNKITMEASHNLYGVTMEQFGISKLVAVKFSEYEESGDNETGLIIDRSEIEKEAMDMMEDIIPENEDISDEVDDSESLDTSTDSNGYKNRLENIDAGDIDSDEDSIPRSLDDLPEKIKERLTDSVTKFTSDDDDIRE